jgi:hypothetical protein
LKFTQADIFISDDTRSASLSAALSLREGNAELTGGSTHGIIQTFGEVTD